MNTHAVNAPLAGPPPGILRHLQRLSHSFVHHGQRISYINIYARPLGAGPEPPLEFITAKESGFEGIACVDDVARAAILALHCHERLGSPAALRLAHDWLGFVDYMQEPDGRFTNFIIDTMGAKNLSGRTSRTGGRWWTARAMWALATAWRVTGDERYLRCFQRGRLWPTSDLKVKGVQALALLELYQAQPDEVLGARIRALCDSLVATSRRYFRDRIGQPEVALWGYHQFQAVARAGRIFSRLDYVAACERTVRYLVEPVIAGGFYHIYPRVRNHQCAYDISPVTLGLEELYHITLKPAYRDLALECAAWLSGHNPAGARVYNPRTGRCGDGITDGQVSLNCGAESAIEAGFIELARRRLQPGAGKKGLLAVAGALLP